MVFQNCAPSDNACTTAGLAACNVQYLGDGTGNNLGDCKNNQLNDKALAGSTYDGAKATCYKTFTDTVNNTCGSPVDGSPIVIDVTGEGFFLTDKAHGVPFRLWPDTPLRPMSWTDPAHHNAWLVLPNADGSVTSLSVNMFGNLSPQPPSSEPNGYAALAYLAEQQGCGKVTKLDARSCPAV